MKFLFRTHTQDCNVKYISYWPKKKKKKEELCLPGVTKQIPRFKAGLLGSESQEFCTLNKLPWGYQYPLNFGVSLQSGNRRKVWNFKQFNRHGRADRQIPSTLFFGLPSVWKEKRDDGARTGIQCPQIQHSCPLSAYYDLATGHFSPTPSAHSRRGPIRPVLVLGGRIVSVFQSRQIKRIQLPDVSLA